VQPLSLGLLSSTPFPNPRSTAAIRTRRRLLSIAQAMLLPTSHGHGDLPSSKGAQPTGGDSGPTTGAAPAYPRSRGAAAAYLRPWSRGALRCRSREPQRPTSSCGRLRAQRLLTVYIRIKLQLDLQTDKSSAVVKGPFFPQV
jgi:hypothetical protein